MKYAAVLLLYALFSFTSLLAGAIGLAGLVIGLPFGRTRYVANIMHSMDMLLAAILGWDGRSTVSKECARAQAAGTPCRLCRFVCAFTHRFLERDHCAKEAARD